MGSAGERIEHVLGGQLRTDYAANRLVVADGNNIDKLLLGVDEDGEIRVKLAQNGIDVKTATPDQLILNSDDNTFKIAEILEPPQFDLNFPEFDPGGSPSSFRSFSTNAIATPHGQGAIPSILVYIYDPDSDSYKPISSGALLKVASGGANPVVRYNASNLIVSIANYYWEISVNAQNVTLSGLFSGAAASTAAKIPALTFTGIRAKIYCLRETAN